MRSPILTAVLAVAHAFGRPLEEISELDPDDLAMRIAWLNEHSPDTLRHRSDNRRTALLASVITNCRFGWAGDSGLEDFLPESEKQADPDALEKQMIAWCANHGGKVIRGDKQQ